MSILSKVYARWPSEFQSQAKRMKTVSSFLDGFTQRSQGSDWDERSTLPCRDNHKHSAWRAVNQAEDRELGQTWAVSFIPWTSLDYATHLDARLEIAGVQRCIKFGCSSRSGIKDTLNLNLICIPYQAQSTAHQSPTRLPLKRSSFVLCTPYLPPPNRLARISMYPNSTPLIQPKLIYSLVGTPFPKNQYPFD